MASSTIIGNTFVGGLVGKNNANVKGDRAGGIVAMLRSHTRDSKINIINCVNNGMISGDVMGGIVARIGNWKDSKHSNSVLISNCSNDGYVGISGKRI